MPRYRTPNEDEKVTERWPSKPLSRRSRRSQMSDPKPPNAFIRFRSTLNLRFPGNKIGQSAAAARLWHDMSHEDKEPFWRLADQELEAWKVRNPKPKLPSKRDRRKPETSASSSRSESPCRSPSPTLLEDPSSWSRESDGALKSLSHNRAQPSPVYENTHDDVNGVSGSASTPSSSPEESTSEPSTSQSQSRHLTPALPNWFIRSHLRGPGEVGDQDVGKSERHGGPSSIPPSSSSSSASTSHDQARPPVPSSVVPLGVPRTASSGMGLGSVHTSMGMSGNNIFPQHPYSAVVPWAQESAMIYPTTSCVGLSGSGKRFPGYHENVNAYTKAYTNANTNPNVPTSTTHPASGPTSGLSSAVDPLVDGDDAGIDWLAFANMATSSLPPASPSQFPDLYGYGSGSGSCFDSGSSNATGLLNSIASTSSDLPWYTHLLSDVNNAPSLDPELFDFGFPTEGGASHSCTPSSSSDVDVDADHARPSLWDSPYLLGASLNVHTPGNDRKHEERDETVDWFGFNRGYFGV